MNKEKYDSLDPAYQAAIVQAVEEAIEEMKPEMKNIDETSKQALVDGGMTLIEYDDSFYQEILALDTVQALYDKIDADVNGLVDWIKAFEVKPQKVFVTHGEDTVTELFAARLRDEMNYDAYAPFSGTEFDLAEGEFLYEAEGVKIQKPAALQKASKAAKVYEKLLALGYRLLSVIRKNEGCANKDLEKFSRDVQSLCDKWDRTDG